MRMTREIGIRAARGAAAAASGLLLWAAFPPLAQADSAWLALVPLLLVARAAGPRAAFGWAWLSGMVFWTLTLSWFPAIIKNGGPWALVILGQVALAAWCAVFLGLFAAVSSRVWRWAGDESGWRRVLAVLAIDPLVWAGTEYARGRLFSGFAWNFLGVSQVDNVAVIQVASLGGVYAVSALVLMVNGAAASLAARAAEPLLARAVGRPARGRPGDWIGRFWQSAEGLLPFAAAMACWAWGCGRLAAWRRAEPGADRWRVALVQPNSPCVFEIDSDAARAELRGRLLEQTRLAGAARPDLTVWPETALLGSVPYEEETMRAAREGAAAAGGPLLTGALEVERVARGPAAPQGLAFYNAAWLFSEGGEPMGRYRKQHLVPFGEYIPLDKRIPWLQRLAPTGVSCTPGDGPGVLTVSQGPGRELSLGPLICFEDTVPALSRRAVRTGADLLVLMTNDAWFDGSIEPVQHLCQSVFRAVENGVPLVRAANSGVSCAVDPVGRVTRLESQTGGAVTDFTGFLVSSVTVPVQPLPAPYTRYGDWLLAIPGMFLAFGLAFCGAVAKVCRRGGGGAA